MRPLLSLILAVLSATASAQTTFKCVDAEKRVTYSNTSCEKQGLKDAGPVSDRIVTLPTVEVRKPAAAAEVRKPAAAGRPEATKAPTPRSLDDDAEVGRSSTQIKPIVPFMERMAK